MRLDPATVEADPIDQFRLWYDGAVDAGVRQPDAMTLATVDDSGNPSARTVLLRGFDARGLAFFTNRESDKAHDLAARPHAALVLHWRELERQVRIAGGVSVVDDNEADAYWVSRPLGHRISAWASPQSRVIDAETLEARVAETELRFAGGEPPRPPFWGGYRVAVDEAEFWESRPDRLHDRVRYRRGPDGGWTRERLAP
ncbi:MAG TPA: pyridoxamine 5'-phosphate oxidase [Acidimicrobiia bacterium]|nr:pyridoxamine 5'-phosphate oxidase [Acidimicrobiia bacterium]